MIAIRALFTLTLLCAPASLAAAPPAQTMTVEAGELDLASEAGQRRLALRIDRAARALCKAEALGTLPQSIRSERACIKAAQSGARAAVQSLITARLRESRKAVRDAAA